MKYIQTFKDIWSQCVKNHPRSGTFLAKLFRKGNETQKDCIEQTLQFHNANDMFSSTLHDVWISTCP